MRLRPATGRQSNDFFALPGRGIAVIFRPCAALVCAAEATIAEFAPRLMFAGFAAVVRRLANCTAMYRAWQGVTTRRR